MEQNDEKLMQMQAKRYAATLRKAGKHSDEAIALAEEDLVEYGLSEEQVEIYLQPEYNIGQMRILSNCLRDNVSEELIRILKKNKLSGHQMQVAVDYFRKGVPTADIEEIVAKGEMPYIMKSTFQAILDRIEIAKRASEGQPEYVKTLVKEIEQMVEKIGFQDKRYDELNEKLAQIVPDKSVDDVREQLTKELESKDAQMADQQNKLNQASATIARLREENDKKKEEMKRMENRINTLEDRLVNMGTGGMREPDTDAHKGDKDSMIRNVEPKQEQIQTQSAVYPQATVQAPASTQPQEQPVPVYYQVPVTDVQGRYVQHVSVEHNIRKSNGVAGFLARLGFKKKSRADIVKLVASGNLVPAQLVQIKSAMEKGLTEGQLIELINNNVAADKMKAIIDIAVLENSLGY